MFVLCMFRILKTVILAVWIGCTAWLIRYEAYPELFEDTVQGYRALARELPAIRDSWLKVMEGDRHVGYAHSSTQIDEQDGEEVIVMSSQLYLRLRAQTTADILELRMRSEIRLDAREEFKDSSLRIFVPDLATGSLTIERVNPGDDRVRLQAKLEILNLPPFSFDQTFALPGEAIVASPLLDIGLSRLRKGEELRIRTLNPFAFDGSTQTLLLRGEGSETWPEGPEGEPITVSMVTMELEDVTLRAWVDEFGRVLRQETPLGFHLEYSTSSQAVQVPDDAALDLNTFLSSSPLPSLPALPFTP